MLFQEGERVKDLGKKHWNSPEALTRLKRLCKYLREPVFKAIKKPRTKQVKRQV